MWKGAQASVSAALPQEDYALVVMEPKQVGRDNYCVQRSRVLSHRAAGEAPGVPE
jgi:hypothetical protein